MGRNSTSNAGNVTSFNLLGVSEDASEEEIDRAYIDRMGAYRNQWARANDMMLDTEKAYRHLKEQRELRRQSQTQPQDIGFTTSGRWGASLFDPSRFVQDGGCGNGAYFYSKQSSSSMSNGKVSKYVKENVNGEVKEYEEHYDVDASSRRPKRKHIRWH